LPIDFVYLLPNYLHMRKVHADIFLLFFYLAHMGL